MAVRKQYIDEEQIRRTVSVIKGGETNGLFEVRIISSGKPYIGYFTDVNVMIEKLRRQKLQDTNVYIMLNEINIGCYSKKARDTFMCSDGTKDEHIEGRQWVLIDLDPEGKRVSGTSSSDEELEIAKAKANDVYKYLQGVGFPDPVIGFSGNGYHLLYKVQLANTPENKNRVEDFLKTLNILFKDNKVKIDKTVANAARVCKLYGTLAQKGSDTEERPHRMSRLLYVPKVIKTVEPQYFDKVIEAFPQEPDAPQQYNNYNGEKFDLEGWLQKYGIEYSKMGIDKDGTRYKLDHCPFNESHKGKDAMIFQYTNGAIGFHCFHDSCAGKTWKDVRVLFDPTAYEKKWQAQDRRMYGHYNRNKELPPPEPLKPTADNPIWYTPMAIFNMPKEDVHYIKTGYEGIDEKLYGLKKKAISVLTGLRSAGKSTWLDGLILNAIQDGNRVGCYSGELDEKNFMRWMIRQAAGKSGVEAGRYEGQWNVPRENAKAISEWLEGKFFLYNNNHGNNYQQIHDEIRKKIEKDKLDLVVIDNLMALDIENLALQKLDAQKNFVLAIKRLAVETDVHILFVAHPRKTVNFLRLEDISGSGDLANAVDNAFLIHRNNEDFKLRSKEMFKWKDDHVAYTGTNVIEVAKDRESGTQDWFIPLWYETETKRMKNSLTENIIYGWREDSGVVDGFIDAPDDVVFD